MSTLQLTRVGLSNGVLTLRLSSSLAVDSFDFWLEMDPSALSTSAGQPIAVALDGGWMPAISYPAAGQLEVSALLTQAAASNAYAPAGSGLLTLSLSLAPSASGTLALLYGGEANAGSTQSATALAFDLAGAGSDPEDGPGDGTAAPPDGGGSGGGTTPTAPTTPDNPGALSPARWFEVGPLQVSSQTQSDGAQRLVFSADRPVTNFDLSIELPANTPTSGSGAPVISAAPGWAVRSNAIGDTLVISGFSTAAEGGASTPLPAGEAFLTLSLYPGASTPGGPAPTLYLSGEINEGPSLVIESTPIPLGGTEPPAEPGFKHWRSNSPLPEAALDAQGLPSKAAPERAEASINLTDVLGALKVYLGKPLPSAYSSPLNAIAADFDGNGSVGLNDVLGLLKYYLGKPTGGMAPQWVFVDSQADLSGINKAQASPPPLQADAPATELIGILRGDVDGSWVG